MTGLRAGDDSQFEQLAHEQAALRRVATRVAHGAPVETLFTFVAEQVAEVLAVPLVSIVGYEPGDTATERANVSPSGAIFGVGSRWSLEGTNVVAQIRDSAQPARIDDYSGLTGEIAETCRAAGIRSTVGSPIVVAGRLWGAMVVSSDQPEPLAPDTEARLTDFTELVATAIANGEARDEVARLAHEQAALRRVATLVASQSSPTEVLRAVADEVAELLGTEGIGILRFEPDGMATQVAQSDSPWEQIPLGTRFPLEGESAVASVLRTGKTARLDDWANASGPVAATARRLGIRSSVAAPIVVEGRLWGTIVAPTAQPEPMPADTELRLEEFTKLVATAIANTESHARAERLTLEQAALRRVATLVAREACQAEVFREIAEAIGRLLGTDEIRMLRYEGDRTADVVGSSGTGDVFPLGSRQKLEGDTAALQVLQSGRTVRIDDYGPVSGPLAETARSIGVRSVVGAPILVEGRLWGAIIAGTTSGDPLPPETEARLDQFTELMATAIANAEARTEVERLAAEQAALRRVATLVAEGAAPTEVFDAVAAEMARLLRADGVTLSRYEPNEEVTVVAHRGANAARVPAGTRVQHSGQNVTSMVRRTERPARLGHYEGTHGAIADLVRDLGVRASVGAPIIVDGQLWGVTIANWQGEQSPPAGTEERMTKFAELLDTAIANADSRDQLTASRARLVTAADEARRGVVRDLHDGAQQALMHTIVTLKLAERALRKGEENAESLISEALENAERGHAELRELAHGILPAVLTRGGLKAAVDALVLRLDLPVRVDVPLDRFPAEIEASAYFIVAEALTNMVKHAQAGRAEVTASLEDEMLQLEVHDDGIGGADGDGHGLVGIADRVTALGGRFGIDSPQGGGTRVTAALPLAPV